MSQHASIIILLDKYYTSVTQHVDLSTFSQDVLDQIMLLLKCYFARHHMQSSILLQFSKYVIFNQI